MRDIAACKRFGLGDRLHLRHGKPAHVRPTGLLARHAEAEAWQARVFTRAFIDADEWLSGMTRSTQPLAFVLNDGRDDDYSGGKYRAFVEAAAAVDLLVRSEYIGHYTSLVGHKFFGTESKDVKRRPQLWIEYGP